MLSRLGRGQFWIVKARADVELSGPKLISSWAGPTHVKTIGPGPILNRSGSSRCLAKRVQANVWVVQARAGVESFGPRPMSSHSGLGRCRVVRVGANVELSGPGPMSSCPGPSRCRVVRAQTDVESFGPGPMSSRSGPGRCRAVWVWADVEPSWSASRLSRLRPSSSQVSLCPYQYGFNVIYKMDLI